MMELETGKREVSTATGAREEWTYSYGNGDSAESRSVVRFRFSLQQKVKLADIKLTGRVIARGDRVGGHIYLVVWWADNKRNEAWLYEHELEG